MPNHVHLIAGARENGNLSAILRDLKKFTANQIIQAISTNFRESRREWMLWLFHDEGLSNPSNSHYQFRQRENHPIELSDNLRITQRLNYLHQNPVRAGICFSAEDYVYSSAS